MLPPYDEGLRELRLGRFVEARRAFEQAASAGEASALLCLGLMASNGQGEPEDAARAAALYRRAADAGCAQAAYNLGALYAMGRGVTRDAQQALKWYAVAADLGDVDGSFKVGTMLARGEVGTPGPEELAEAERRWRACAASGHVGSMFFLGNLHNGLGPERSAGKAAYWYLEALISDNADQRDVAEAHGAIEKLLPELVKSGDVDALVALGGWHMTCDVHHEKAASYFGKAAAEGHPGAQRSLGFLMLEGSGVEQDAPAAIALFEAAARGGDRFAQFNLGAMHSRGESLPRDSEKAVAYLQAAAQQGVVDAMAMLGDELGRVDRDAEARAWYIKAAERGHVGAMNAAASYCRDGLGGPRDLVQAIRWYFGMLASGNGDGIHEAHQLVSQMTDDEIREAGRLAGEATFAESLLESSGRA